MRKPIYSMTVSLDGYIAGPDGGIDWCAPWTKRSTWSWSRRRHLALASFTFATGSPAHVRFRKQARRSALAALGSRPYRARTDDRLGRTIALPGCLLAV
jgi:hypothetical protein